ncbi:hypothetical protein LZG72_03140 [Dyadobacter sp. CY323]|nr:hypothetical protein [Dyadobacter sp. CY323]
MKIEITPELIIRYHQGQCTQEEKEVVVEWLLDPEAEENLHLPDGEPELIHKFEIWQGISNGVKKNARRGRLIRVLKKELYAIRPITRLAIAATVLLFVGSLAAGIYYPTRSVDGQVSLDNLAGNTAKNGKLASLSFTLSPQSKAEANIPAWTRAVQIRFCGSLQVTNNSENDVELVFSSGCKKTNYTLQKVTVAKGKSYLATHYRMETDEIIVVDKARILDLPPPLVSQFIKDFKLI